MNKTIIPALLVATIMVAGAFAFVPVEQATTVHLSGTVVSDGLDNDTGDVLIDSSSNAVSISAGTEAVDNTPGDISIDALLDIQMDAVSGVHISAGGEAVAQADGVLALTSTAGTVITAGDLTMTAGNILMGTDEISFTTTTQNIDSTTDGLEFDVPTGDWFEFQVNSVEELRIAGLVINAPTNTFQEAGEDISPIGTQEIMLTMGNFAPDGANGCTIADSTIANTEIETCSYANGADNAGWFTWFPPTNWNEGTVTATIFWTSTATTAGNNLEWEVACMSLGDGDIITAGTLGTTVNVLDIALTQGDIMIAESGVITCGGPAAEDDSVFIRVLLDVSAGNTDGAVLLIGLIVEYTIDAATT